MRSRERLGKRGNGLLFGEYEADCFEIGIGRAEVPARAVLSKLWPPLVTSPFRPQPAGRGCYLISMVQPSCGSGEWPLIAEQVDVITGSTRPLAASHILPVADARKTASLR